MTSEYNKILCLGEVLIDLIAADDHLLQYYCHFGGSPANVAVHLAKMGHKVAFAGAVGSDFLGDYIIDFFNYRKVDISLLVQLPRKPTSIVVINEHIDPPIPIYHKNADFYYHYSSKLQDMIDLVDIIHTTAHSLAFDPLRTTVIKSLKYGSKKQKIITFDPNFRPMINIEDQNFKQTVFDALQYVDIIKPSLDDSLKLFDDSLSPNEIITRFKRLGVNKSVIVTCGGKGVYYLDEKQKIQFEPVIPVENIVGITGAGDAFWSGFLSVLIKQGAIKEGIKSGIRSAAEKIRYKGAIRQNNI